MEFAFTDEQRMIQDTTVAFLKEVSTSDAVRKAMATEQGYDNALWQSVCTDLYWQAIHIPETYGGMGLGYVELVAMLEQMGRYLFCSPFYATVCLATNALLVAGTEAQKTRYLPAICEGTTATLAFTGDAAGRKGGDWSAGAVTVIYEKVADGAGGYVLNGRLRYVPDGHSADLLIIAAREKDTVGTDGISLFVVPATQPGVARKWLPSMDQTRKQAEITLDNAVVPADAVMVNEGHVWPLLSKVLDLATIALAAEQMGGAQQVLDIAVEYAKERVQFNRTIASFQAIKHKAADMMTRAEVARSAVYYAGCVAQEALFNPQDPFANELDEAASIAKSYCSDAFFRNAADALQMHGGVGFTWEYDVHLYFKRAKASEQFLGNGAWHRERLAQLFLD
ncbi:MAG: acyl-CoA dehydrogenase family protein [Ketobacteraceae bacterium]|nr:acyl-CoA dehydrogenase family protein [Ketobacteraceae bacterium]